MHDPVQHIAERLRPGGRCLFMPNGGNLGDMLIAAATIQRFEQAGVPWEFLRGRRHAVTPADILAFGGGGSLVPQYDGGIACVASLTQLGAPVVVLPQSLAGHEAFWHAAHGITVFCRDAVSLEHARRFPHLVALPADDMAIGLDLAADPFSTVRAIRAAVAARGEERILRAFRQDCEAAGPAPVDTFDVSALAHPQPASVATIQAHACGFLTLIATYSAIHTDRLHVAIAGGLLGIPTWLSDNSYGKNRAVHAASLQGRFPMVTIVGPNDGGLQNA